MKPNTGRTAATPSKAVKFTKPQHPWHPCPWEVPDVAAFQALARGDATAEQQKRAVDYLINIAANTYDMSFRAGYADAQKEQDFAEGRRFVGNTIVKFLRLNLMAFQQGGT